MVEPNAVSREKLEVIVAPAARQWQTIVARQKRWSSPGQSQKSRPRRWGDSGTHMDSASVSQSTTSNTMGSRHESIARVDSQKINVDFLNAIEGKDSASSSFEAVPGTPRITANSNTESVRDLQKVYSVPNTSRFITQVFLLLWKNILLDLRRCQSTMLEVLFPTLFALVLLFMRIAMDVDHHDAVIYAERDSRSYFDFLQGKFPQLGFFPETNATVDVIKRAVMMHINKEIPDCTYSRESCLYRGFAVENEAIGYWKEFEEMSYLIHFTGVRNKKSKTMPKKAKFLIRPFRKMNQLWHTDQNFPFDKAPVPMKDQEDYPFLYIQTLLARAVMANWRNDSYTQQLDTFNISYLRFPSPAYEKDEMYTTIKMQLTLFEVLAYMLIAFVYTKNIVQEKENKLKESMKLIGLKLPAYWLSWCLTFLIFIMPTILMFTLVLTADLSGKGPILSNIDPSIIFFQLICYSIALISYSFFISTLVQKSSDGMIISGLVFLLIYVPFEVVSQRYQDLTHANKLLYCLLFNVALGFSNFIIIRREFNGMGVKWEDLKEPIYEGDITLAETLGMLLVDAAIFALFTWYIDNVYPGDYGVPRRWNFFLKASYWCNYKSNKQCTILKDLSDTNVNYHFFEKKGKRYHTGIHASRLTKRFGDLVSVNNLNLKMYEGEITVLLGHNGAGKTTTMSMLTGFIPPSDGTAVVNGYNIRYNITRVRRSLGLCPQHDILYDALTPYEHLWFYSKLKGYTSKTLKKEILAMLKEVGFENHANKQLVSTMSAGQKRSLSVGIALLGDSKVVILDEPSSGMDPSTRRHTWDVLMKYRRNRTMLLTTHYMDEADALGDRIAILAKGELQCCGSSMFLKKLYGAGMRLTVEGNEMFNQDLLIQVMDEEFPEYTVESSIDQFICFLLPETATSAFPNLLRHLSDNKKELGIANFGIKTTTMEEVFLKSENKAIKAAGSNHNSDSKPSVKTKERRSILSIDIGGVTHDHGLGLLWRRCKAQIKKWYIIYRIHYITTAAQFLLPPLFYMVYIFIDNNITKEIDRGKPLKWFNIDDYGITNVFVFDNKASSDFLKIMRESGSHKIVFIPKRYESQVNDYSESLTTNDIRKWILDKYSETSLYEFDRTSIMGILFTDAINATAVVMYNAEVYHSLFTANQLAINSFVRYFFGPKYSIETGNYPLDKEGQTEILIWYGEEYRSAFFVGLFIGIGFCIYSSFFVYYLLRERVTGVKHMHAMFGVGMVSYWLPTFLWNTLCFLPPTALLFTIFNVFDKEEFLSNWVLMLLVMGLYTWAALPSVYVQHFLFETPSSGLVGTVIINLFSVVFSDIIFNEFNSPKSMSKKVGEIVDWIFSATIPAYNLSQSFGFVLLNHGIKKKCVTYQDHCEHGGNSLCCMNHPGNCKSDVPDSECFKWTNNYYNFHKGEGIGSYMTILVMQGIVSWLVVYCIEVGPMRFPFLRRSENSINKSEATMRKPSNNNIPGVDLVEKEKTNVISMKQNIDTEGEKCLVMVGITKKFGDNVAVDNIYATARPGECFALLGQSGAGKTTLFRMLTGQTMVTSGDAYINGHSVRTSLNAVQDNIGYCPQFDAHIPEMTSHETLRFYARLRGIPEYLLTTLCNNLIEKVLLDDSAIHKCGTYSGGNRRKLSLAIALVGFPPFILLDEPSSGMDPKARRQMWNVLNELRERGSTIVMTSHSMEECEALSTKLAIMLNGSLLCMDTPQHLKQKFGQGYTVIIKEGGPCEGESTSLADILDFIKVRLPETEVFDEHPGYLHLQIPNKNIEIWEVFAAMEDCKAALSIEDYIVNETTLEQIFLAFTKANERNETVNLDEDAKWSCWNVQAGFFDDKFWKCVGK